MKNPELVLDHKCLLGEGALWDHHTNAICWVDILNGQIHEYSTSTNGHRIHSLNEMVGTIALCNNGDFLAAIKSGVVIVNREGLITKRLVHPEAHLPGNRYNDGKCDPGGRLWVGSIALDESEGAANLYRINPDLSTSTVITNVTISNGMAWSGDQRTFYYIDTPTLTVSAFDYDLSRGQITNGRTAIEIPRSEGWPDGMTIDEEGMLWIAHWDGWQVARWNPNTGKKLLSIRLPAAHVSCCTFGGQNFGDLYITTARKGLTPAQLQEQPLAGSLFVVRDCGYNGRPTFEFDQAAV
jgi:sugar lactone lactonase YvrE